MRRFLVSPTRSSQSDARCYGLFAAPAFSSSPLALLILLAINTRVGLFGVFLFVYCFGYPMLQCSMSAITSTLKC